MMLPRPLARRSILMAIAAITTLAAGTSQATVQIGKTAPELTATDTRGKPVSLSALRGRHVVVEWTNPNCPFVRKHYQSDNMPSLQREFTAKGIVWLQVNSTRTDHVDYLAPARLDAWLTEHKAVPTALLMDEGGSQGRQWGARTTPQMFIIDPKGVVIYAGAIDSIPSASGGDIARATNYVRQGLTEALAGKPVSTPTSTPYGCSVKYAG